jgi:hypothetical protein
VTYCHKLSRRLAICRYPGRSFSVIAPLLFLLACAPGELKEGFEPEGPATLDDVTEVTITPEKPSLGTDEMVRIRVHGRTDSGEELLIPMDWTADGGTIVQTSNYEAYFSSTSSGTFKVIGRGRNKNKPVDTTTVVVIEPTYSIVSIAVSPDPASVIEGLSQTFTASGLRSDGSSASPSVSWSATGGTISSGGVYTAGGTEGDFVVTAVSTENLSDVAAVSVEPAPLQGPNEPTGLTPIFEKNFSSLPGTVGGDLYGVSSGLYRGGDTTITLVQDASAPFSPSGTLRTRWPKGLPSGSSPGAWWFWNAFNANATAYREIYLSFRAKIPTADFENQAVYTKLIYFAHGGDGTYTKNDDVIALRGNGTNGLMTSMEIVFSQSQADDRTGEGSGMPRYQNVNTTKEFTAGAWHQVEVYANVGTVDQYNGVAKVWIDGVLVTQYTNLKFLDSRYNYVRGFYEGQWTPVWGGMGGTKTRDDYMLLDHLYVSGRL